MKALSGAIPIGHRPDRDDNWGLGDAPVAQLNRVLASEGKDRRFEPCRARDFHNSQFREDGSRLQKFYYYSPAAAGRKDLLQVTHRIYENFDENDFEEYDVAYFTDGYYARPKGLEYPGGTGLLYEWNKQGPPGP